MAGSVDIRNPLSRDVEEVRLVGAIIEMEIPFNEEFNFERERKIFSDFLSKASNLNPLQKLLIRKAALLEPQLNSEKSVDYTAKIESGHYRLNSTIKEQARESRSDVRSIFKILAVALDFKRPYTMSMPENPRKIITDLVKSLEFPPILKELAVSISTYAGETLSINDLAVTDSIHVKVFDAVQSECQPPTSKSTVGKGFYLATLPIQFFSGTFHFIHWNWPGEKRWMVYSNNSNNTTMKEQQNEELNAALQTIENSLQRQEEIRQTAQDLGARINQQSEQDRTSTQTLLDGKEELLKEIETLKSYKGENVELLKKLLELEKKQQDVNELTKRIEELMGLIKEKNEKGKTIKVFLERTLSTKKTLEEYKADIREVIRIIQQ